MLAIACAVLLGTAALIQRAPVAQAATLAVLPNPVGVTAPATFSGCGYYPRKGVALDIVNMDRQALERWTTVADGQGCFSLTLPPFASVPTLLFPGNYWAGTWTARSNNPASVIQAALPFTVVP